MRSDGRRGLFPTPTAASYGTGQNGCPHDGREKFAGAGAPSLSTIAKNWPTATVSDKTSSRRHGYMHTGHSGTTLNDAIDSHHQVEGTTTDGEPTSPPVVLNPRFVEALMGFPPGWVSLPDPQISLHERSNSPLLETPLSHNVAR